LLFTSLVGSYDLGHAWYSAIEGGNHVYFYIQAGRDPRCLSCRHSSGRTGAGRTRSAQQVPPVQTSATGKADLTYDPSTRVVTWTITCEGLSGPVTMAHFHVAQAGKNGSVAIWLSKQGSSTSCPISGQATLTPEQAKQFTAGEWYINIHTKAHPPGEMRGQVTPPKT